MAPRKEPKFGHVTFPKTLPKDWRPDKLSPSSAHRWINCPGSVAAELCVPTGSVPRFSAAAEEGTRAHLLLEVMFVLGLRPDEVPLGLEDEEVDKAMRKAVAFAVQYVHTWQHEHPLGEVATEAGVTIGHHLADNVKGTPDLALTSPEELCVVDFKYGMVQVPAQMNYQLMLYALSKLTKHYWPKLIRLVIIQPRLRGGEPIDEWTLTPDELVAWADLVAMPPIELINTRGIDAPRHAGSWCDWCGARGTCPALIDMVFKTAGMQWTNDAEEIG